MKHDQSTEAGRLAADREPYEAAAAQRANRIANLTRLRTVVTEARDERDRAFRQNQLNCPDVRIDILLMWLRSSVEHRAELATIDELLRAEAHT